jgi:hypothetical protein
VAEDVNFSGGIFFIFFTPAQKKIIIKAHSHEMLEFIKLNPIAVVLDSRNLICTVASENYIYWAI